MLFDRPQLLVLDEATSALDTMTEQEEMAGVSVSRSFATRCLGEPRERLTLMSATPNFLFVQARKLEHRAVFTSSRYQSDYVTTWSAAPLATGWSQALGSMPSRLRNAGRHLVPARAKERMRSLLYSGPRSCPDLHRQLRQSRAHLWFNVDDCCPLAIN